MSQYYCTTRSSRTRWRDARTKIHRGRDIRTGTHKKPATLSDQVARIRPFRKHLGTCGTPQPRDARRLPPEHTSIDNEETRQTQETKLTASRRLIVVAFRGHQTEIQRECRVREHHCIKRGILPEKWIHVHDCCLLLWWTAIFELA